MQTRQYISEMQDFRRGTISGVQDRKRGKPTWVRRSRNLIGRPHGSLSTRPGCRDLSSAALSDAPHSLLKFSHASAPELFVGAGDSIYEVTASAYTLQTIPGTPTTADWSHENINGALVATQLGGSNLPIMYDGASWKELKLPSPGATMTLGQSTDGAPTYGGLTLTATYFYRLRWIFDNGSSLASTPQSITLTGTNNQVDISTIPNAGGGRDDLIGWRLERTEANATVNGPYYFVADGSGTTYADDFSDSNIGYRADNGIHGDPVHFDGVTKFANRLIGWSGSTLYISQEPGDLEGTGICNFDPELVRLVDKDDGDIIKLCIPVGDELLILKRRSVHRMLGNDPTSFQVLAVLASTAARGAEAGVVGHRAAATIGGACYFWGEGGLFKYASGSVKPVGWVEVGDEMEAANPAEADKRVLVNQVGDYLVAFYARNPSDANDHAIVYDARFDQWWVFDGWRARDAIVQRDDSFGGATLIFCDEEVSEGTVDASGRPFFLTWGDEPSVGGVAQWKAQSIDSADGTVDWPTNGVASSASIGGVTYFLRDNACCYRSDGGIIQCGYEQRAGGHGLWAHRLDAAGAHQWSGTTGVNIKSATGSKIAGGLGMCPDGADGAFIVWWDTRTGAGRVYVQRINASGVVQFAADGVLCGDGTTGSTVDAEPEIRPDGAGGAFIVWRGTVGGVAHVLCQRVSSAGALGMAAGGLDLGVQGDSSFTPTLAVSTDQMLLVALEPTANALVAKKVSAAGVVQWTTANLSPGRTLVFDPIVVADDDGGALVFWRGDYSANRAVYGQGVDSAGNTRWVGDTVLAANIGTSGYTERETWAVEDGSGGALVAFLDDVGGAPQHVRLVKITKNGTMPWGSVLQVDSLSTIISSVAMSVDGAGGCIIGFSDGQTNAVVYVVRVISTGTILWTSQIRSGTGRCYAWANYSAYLGAPEGETVTGSSPGYRVWAGFDGTRDYRDKDGLSGQGIAWSVETPAIDDADQLGKASNQPKEYGRVRAFFDCDPNTFAASLVVEPSGRTVGLTLPVGGVGASWADDLVAAEDDLVWDEGEWAGDTTRPVTAAFPTGTIGERYRMAFSGVTETGMTFEGFELDCVLQPERRADQ